MCQDQQSPIDTSFAELLGDGIKQIKDDKVHHQLHAKKPRPVPTQRFLDEQQVLSDMLSDDYQEHELQPGDLLEYCSPGLQKSVFLKLKRGQISIAKEIDLHGMNAAQAKEMVLNFIHYARRNNHLCVRIIHGKGRRSSNNGPVLKNKVNTWLRQMDDVLAFSSARPNDGGTGAVYVLLRR